MGFFYETAAESHYRNASVNSNTTHQLQNIVKEIFNTAKVFEDLNLYMYLLFEL